MEIIEENYQDTSLPVEIYLFQGLPKSDKMELIIQKCVELGVDSIVPVEMSRCVVKLEDKKKKIEEKVSKMVATTFEKGKTLKADIFGAFDIANKFHYKKTKAKFENMEEFLEKLKLNVEVKVSRLEH